MFLFDNLQLLDVLAWICVVAALMGLNELARSSKLASVLSFIVLPIVLTLFVWPHTAGPDSSTGTWFHWVKVYSALAGCLGFMALRYFPNVRAKRWLLAFPPFILAFNICEAVIRDFQVAGLHGMVDGVFMNGGVWNIMNGIAGILNIITITGWFGIRIAKNRQQDMVWPDQIWPWIVAYDVWNFAYVYNCVGDHSFYAGLALLIAPTAAAMLLHKGTWLQDRAQTLAFWMMFTMSYPTFVTDSQFAVASSHNSTGLFVVSFLALAINVAVLVMHLYRIKKNGLNPFKDEVYADTKAYAQAIK